MSAQWTDKTFAFILHDRCWRLLALGDETA